MTYATKKKEEVIHINITVYRTKKKDNSYNYNHRCLYKISISYYYLNIHLRNTDKYTWKKNVTNYKHIYTYIL